MDEHSAITLSASAITALYPYVFFLDPQQEITWASPAVRRVLGSDPVGKDIFDVVSLPISGQGNRLQDFGQDRRRMFPIKIITPNGPLPLRALCLCSDDNAIIGLVAEPDLSTLEQLERFDIRMDDFFINDPHLDLLLMMGELTASKADLNNAVEELNRKQAELQEAGSYRQQLDARLKELVDQRHAMLNMIEDVEAARAEIQDLNKGLEKRVQTEIEKRREKEQLLIHQSRLAAMGEMIGNIAHQWRQPLTEVGLVIQDLGDAHRHGELDEAYMVRGISKAMQITRHMSRTIDDFRNFFRPEKTKRKFRVRDSLERASSFVESAFRNCGIRIELAGPEDITAVGFPNEFAQALLNVLNNARDALIERKVQNPVINITLFQENDRAVVTLADNAGGISPELVDRIFEPYFTTKEPDKGTGIGLYMAKMIIEKNMGGSLSVRNINGGAEFRIELAGAPAA
jgi:signal transduction histidine kinase